MPRNVNIQVVQLRLNSIFQIYTWVAKPLLVLICVIVVQNFKNTISVGMISNYDILDLYIKTENIENI